MQFRDLKEQYNVLEKDINKAIQSVLSKCNFISGDEVGELEELLAEYVGIKHCVTCGNGTDAMSMMMMAWDIHEGDAVFVPDFTFFSSGEIVAHAGAVPVFYDVELETYNADINSLENAIRLVIEEGNLRPRAIIAVDLFGLPANYTDLERLAEKYNLRILEDSAQGFGGKIGVKRAGSFGDAATTSFFPAKPLGCYGDGGAIFTNDDETAKYLRSIAVHGKGKVKYDNIRIGMNSRLDTLQAAILKVKLEAFKRYELYNVNKIAEMYNERLKDIVTLPVTPEGFYSSWAQYTIQLNSSGQREKLQQYLRKHNIPTAVYYIKPMHSQLAFSRNKEYVECKNTEKLCNTVLSLPMHPYLSEKDCDFICMNIKRCLLDS
ncbi:DegT/DnrJ/EryC1/StrS family aminotransferase [[Clostridium] hylemonae]|uniref:DegT/DnrJ/EryC1/StrS aminotransferase family protein n=1 Tax=[Clostridium] hylemonae DSM 15053 TaxID=553973 RepID=C0C2D0_9FIRM|nr:DegT/DnrJ/EryC1/StrS family aminotransferase [[Clostridium] hylemonae]EEG73554.1 DegT/DnrJ/EryC1/StrS aminotransferase family protein [[Clostridium] hylemonae DSM 15053]QEK17155.1 UDP-2-acetamido-2-deoxy-3-oxo-D-glucuronate aminotransferase [[Clostridium] hylemonae DSM 15053]